LSIIKKEKQEAEFTLKNVQQARAARIAKLFEESSDDLDSDEDGNEDKLDSYAAKENLTKFMSKLDKHLNLEKVLIEDWKDQLK
jgi:hypothetical protein